MTNVQFWPSLKLSQESFIQKLPLIKFRLSPKQKPMKQNSFQNYQVSELWSLNCLLAVIFLRIRFFPSFLLINMLAPSPNKKLST
jgi:hypothetical protein